MTGDILHEVLTDLADEQVTKRLPIIHVAMDLHWNRSFVFLCLENYTQGHIIWLKGDTYTMNASQMFDRLKCDLTGFMENFLPANDSARALFEAIAAGIEAMSE